MKKKISIIGCGWLGFPLAKHFVDNGYVVKGSTTTKAKLKTLSNAGIEAFTIQLNEKGITGNYPDFFKESDTVIINIPPGLRKNPNKNHVEEIQHLIKAIATQSIKNIIYISSTSVFNDESDFPVINDSSAPNATTSSAKQLIAIEDALQKNPKFNTTIIRFGGLYDAQRHPAKFLAGKTNVSNPEAPVNLIHKEDCINIISLVLKKNIQNEILNAVHPDHPSKKEYYTNYCKEHQLELPKFNMEEKNKGKLIESIKLEQLLNYSWKQAL